MRAFYSLYGSQNVKLVHILREGAERRRPKWRYDGDPIPQGWCGTSGWGRITAHGDDGLGRRVVDPMPEEPPAGLQWCPTCIGRVMRHLDLIDEAARLVARTAAATAAPDIPEGQR